MGKTRINNYFQRFFNSKRRLSKLTFPSVNSTFPLADSYYNNHFDYKHQFESPADAAPGCHCPAGHHPDPTPAPATKAAPHLTIERRQVMERRHKRRLGPAQSSAPVPECAVSARVPEPVRWRWRPHAHFRSSHCSRSEPPAADGGLVDTGWIEDRRPRGCRPEELLGPLGSPTTAVGPGRPLTRTAALPCTVSRRHAFICKCPSMSLD